MTKQGYGAKDKDRIGKEKTDRPLKGPGSEAAASARIGGVGGGNSPSATKVGSFRKGGKFPFPKGKK
jgi:hypothetical protein